MATQHQFRRHHPRGPSEEGGVAAPPVDIDDLLARVEATLLADFRRREQVRATASAVTSVIFIGVILKLQLDLVYGGLLLTVFGLMAAPAITFIQEKAFTYALAIG
ncbi:uncharacterized protein EHS24_006844 [Apiotrichum porosum]|uniref:Uncharacterized protein n=1 Tax=Apiotrichum porosum TaxID=105984 RepID=A0A427XWG0_9TREE|nr:uncharacterized protein EHS24_006844 [Apiotrichum porosum]RSH83184.1 hypothetical protein EHS24_006844 [Apiotrichum porosum]